MEFVTVLGTTTAEANR